MTELKLMAAATIMGFSSSPRTGTERPLRAALRERYERTRRRESDECCSWCVDSNSLAFTIPRMCGMRYEMRDGGDHLEVVRERLDLDGDNR
jgi:hypothetical protein